MMKLIFVSNSTAVVVENAIITRKSWFDVEMNVHFRRKFSRNA